MKIFKICQFLIYGVAIETIGFFKKNFDFMKNGNKWLNHKKMKILKIYQIWTFIVWSIHFTPQKK